MSRKHQLSFVCVECNCEFTSEKDLTQHQQGKKHKKRLDKLAQRKKKAERKAERKNGKRRDPTASEDVIGVDAAPTQQTSSSPATTGKSSGVTFHLVPPKVVVTSKNALADATAKPTPSLAYTSKPYSFASSSQNSRTIRDEGFILGARRNEPVEVESEENNASSTALSELAPPFRPPLSTPTEDFLALDVNPEKTRKEEKKRKRDTEREEAEREELLREKRGRLPPWAECRYSYDRLALHREIEDYVEYVRPSPFERALRKDLLETLREIVADIWPDATLHVFGSYTTDLYLPTSDLDCMVEGATHRMPECLFVLAKRIEERGLSEQIEVISTARVPLVKYIDRVSGIQIDISFDALGGLANTAMVKELLEEHPALRPLVIIIKSFLQQRGLNVPYTGGLGSYSLVLLVTSILQHWERKAIRERRDLPYNLGTLLIEFFRFFGKEFNYFLTGISVRHGGRYFSKFEKDWLDPARPFLLALEDPQDEANDVGRSSFKILLARRAFEHAYARLHEQPPPGPHDEQATLLSRIIFHDPLLDQQREYVRSLYPNLSPQSSPFSRRERSDSEDEEVPEIENRANNMKSSKRRRVEMREEVDISATAAHNDRRSHRNKQSGRQR